MDQLRTHYGLIIDSLLTHWQWNQMDSVWTRYGLIMNQLKTPMWTHKELIVFFSFKYDQLIGLTKLGVQEVL